MTTDPTAARRILIYGVTGSGRSTAAKRVAARTGLPLTLADELTWKPDWVPVSGDRQRELFDESSRRIGGFWTPHTWRGWIWWCLEHS